MSLIASATYDPATAASVSTASLRAMTAMDTTNLRLTFTAPANGQVLVRIRVVQFGNGTAAAVLLGVLEGSTVIARQAPAAPAHSSSVTARATLDAIFPVTGISAGSHTWDAAYAVQVVATSGVLEWGGPNNATTNDAWGAVQFEIWGADNLLASAAYDPSTAASKATSAGLAMTAVDTTNLRVTFTAPASGNVFVHMRCTDSGGSAQAQILLGVLSGATVIGRVSPIGGRTNLSALASNLPLVWDAQFVVTGLSGSQTWDAAYSVDGNVASSAIQYGGPNNASGANAWGMFLFSVWSV